MDTFEPVSDSWGGGGHGGGHLLIDFLKEILGRFL